MYSPRRNCASARLSPRASTRIRISPGPGLRSGSSPMASTPGPPLSDTRTPPVFQRGTLVNPDGSAVTGMHKVKVALHDAEPTGNPLCASAESTVDVTATRGQFRIPLAGGTGDCVQVVHQVADLWVAVTL